MASAENDASHVHHHTPRFYLRGWCRDGLLSRYERVGEVVKIRRCSPKSTAFEIDLYSLDHPVPAERDAVERFLSKHVDGPASESLRTLLQGKDLTAVQRLAWVRFVLSLTARSPDSVSNIREKGALAAEQALRDDHQEYERLRRPTDPPTLLEWVRQESPHLIPNFGITQLPSVIGSEKYVNALFSLPHWTIPLDSAEVDLVTTDRPVIIAGTLDAPDVAWIMALNPRCAFIATPDGPALHTLQGLDPTAFANWLNGHLIPRARRFVYATGPQHRSIVETLLPSPAAPPSAS